MVIVFRKGSRGPPASHLHHQFQPIASHYLTVALWSNGQHVGLLSVCVKQFKGCVLESHQSRLLPGILAKTATAPSWQDGRYLSSVYFEVVAVVWRFCTSLYINFIYIVF